MTNTPRQTCSTTAVIFPELVQRRVPLTASDAEARAHAILAQAERQAQALMESARQKASSLMEAGHREGVLQGRAEALAEARDHVQALIQSLTVACDRVRALEAECRAGSDELIVSLALAVAERILRAEVTQQPAMIVGVVRTAMAGLPSPDEVVVRVHPDALALLQAHREELQDATPGLSALRALADPAVPPGGCVVETPHSVVDATFPAQLGEARRRLLELPW